MAVDSNGYWKPDLFPKQEELLRACLPSKKNLVLASGPRWASKTVGALGAVAQHAWNTDRGNICLLTITQSVGIDSGVWADLTDITLPDWIGWADNEGNQRGGNFGMEWVRKPYIQNVTKKPACEVSNRFGNKTKISLESLKNEDEVEERFKGKRYSMIFVNELSKFTKRKTFDTLKQCLRMMHLKEEDHLFLCDTNPSDEGQKSWIYKLWYEFRVAQPEDFKKIFPDYSGIDPQILVHLRDALNLIEFTIDDNLAASPSKKASLMADFAHDEDLLQRYYYGKWVAASTDALFHRVFRPKFHCIGEIASAVNDWNPQILVPEPGCFELITGHDPGPVNYAATIIEKTFRKEIAIVDEKETEVRVSVFKQLDELVVTDADFDLDDFIEQFVAKMDFWERMCGRPGSVLWKHWSDRSVFDMKIPFSDRYWHQEILRASGGRLALMAAGRGKGSVNQRIGLFRKLLFNERWFASNDKCPNTIEMCKSIKKGTTAASGIAKGSVHKHIFDGTTYPLAEECFEELQDENILMLRRESNGKPQYTSVPL